VNRRLRSMKRVPCGKWEGGSGRLRKRGGGARNYSRVVRNRENFT
jgi:hypothetical protein